MLFNCWTLFSKDSFPSHFSSESPSKSKKLKMGKPSFQEKKGKSIINLSKEDNGNYVMPFSHEKGKYLI